MAEKTFNQKHDGYWRESNRGGIPKESGIYCVYECTHNVEKKNLSIHKLIYVGESSDVNSRIAKHEKTEDWKKHVKKGNVLCFSFSPIEDYYRERVEAAYINHHKPIENIEYVDEYPYDKTLVNTNGKSKYLDKSFIVI